jgi:hypothetical protein
MRFLRPTGGFAPYNLSGFSCGASPVGASFATGSVGLLVLPDRLLGPSGASAATVPVGAGFDAGGETGTGATVGGTGRPTETSELRIGARKSTSIDAVGAVRGH